MISLRDCMKCVADTKCHAMRHGWRQILIALTTLKSRVLGISGVGASVADTERLPALS
jgi:hypothetical protein